jgi:hypothetical protein
MTSGHGKPPRYRSYLLRFWEARSRRPEKQATWRFSLEDPQTGKKRGFPDLEALVEFLQSELEHDRRDPEPDRP